MYEELYEPLPDRELYLKRLQVEASGNLNVEYLDRLILAHQSRIPFENLDIFELGKCIDLSTQGLFDKVILKKRGGYCFELNALFDRLLSELGYQVYPCLSRILRGKDFIPPALHRGILVLVQGQTWFCDVGYGGPMPGGALLVEDGYEKTCCNQTFGIEQSDEYWWTVVYLSGGRQEKILQFTLMPQGPVDFLASNEYCSRNENSVFLQQRMVNLRTADGSMSIVNDIFSQISNQQRTEKKIQSPKELNHILKDYFGIKLSAKEP